MNTDQSRRAFLSTAAKTLLGVTLAPSLLSLARADEPANTATPVRRPTARNLIYLYMAGGMSHLDTFDPKTVAEVQGPGKAIATAADGIQISENFPRLAKQMRHVAVVRSMTSNQGAHEPGSYLMRTSFAQRGTILHPSMGAWMSYLGGRTNPTLPAAITVGGGGRNPGAGYLEARHAPLPIGNPEAGLSHSAHPDSISDEQFDRRLDVMRQFNHAFEQKYEQKAVRGYRDLYDEAVSLMHSKDLAAFDLKQESAEVRAAYGDSQFAQGCLLARRLVEHDVRYVEVNLGGWDTHDDNFDRVAGQAEILDGALSSLIADLHGRGLLDETLIAVATEFGRTPTINGNNGRDHFPKAFSCLLAGGGIRGGQVYGASDERGAVVADKPVTIPDFNATIGFAAGLPIDRIVHSPEGRPFTLADKGKPLTALL